MLTAVGEILSPEMAVNPVTNATITPTLDLVQDCAAFNQSCESGLLVNNGVSVFDTLLVRCVHRHVTM